MVSTLYQYYIEASYKTLPLDRIWRRDVPELEHTLTGAGYELMLYTEPT